MFVNIPGQGGPTGAHLDVRHDLQDIGSITVTQSTVTVGHDLATSNITAAQSNITVDHDLVNVRNVDVTQASIEVGHNVGSTQFSLHDGRLVLDKPPHKTFDNQINISAPSGRPPGAFSFSSIELGNIAFNQADFIPSMPGGHVGQIQLKNNGAPVYTLTNVSGVTSVSVNGVDPATGYNILSIRAFP